MGDARAEAAQCDARTAAARAVAPPTAVAKSVPSI
jgi:hypothetical protein